jgi:hypothetical protein
MHTHQTKKILGLFADLAPIRSLTGPEKTQFRIYNACLQVINQGLNVCRNIISLIANGNARSKDNYTTDAIYTDPDSANLYLQAKQLDQLVPPLNNTSTFSRFDINHLLQQPIIEKMLTYSNPMHDFLQAPEIADKIDGYVIHRNSTHPINTVFKLLIELKQTNKITFVNAGKDILNVISNQPSQYNATDLIQTKLAHITKIFVYLACEPNRLHIADEMHSIADLDKLWVTAKTAIVDVVHYGKVLNKQWPYINSDIIYADDISFTQLTDNDLNTLSLLIKWTGSITHGLSFFDTSSKAALAFLRPAIPYDKQNWACYAKYSFSPSVPSVLSLIHDTIFKACNATVANFFLEEFKNFAITFAGSDEVYNNCKPPADELLPDLANSENYVPSLNEYYTQLQDWDATSWMMLLSGSITVVFALIMINQCCKPLDYVKRLFLLESAHTSDNSKPRNTKIKDEEKIELLINYVPQ